jgi:F420-0:gamma-glutamyl ligase
VRIYKLGILVSCAFQAYLSCRLVVLALKRRGGGELVKTDERILYIHLEIQFLAAKAGIDQTNIRAKSVLPNLTVF